jgi:outer membrane receptor protein involved in Fe transport
VFTVRGIVLLSCLAVLGINPAYAQLQLATVRGVVLDDGSQPVAAVAVELTDPLGGVVRAQVSDAGGRFAFDAVAPGRYALRASLDGFAPVVQALGVEGALAHDVTLRLLLRTAVAVTVDESAQHDSPTARVSLAGDSIDRVPVRGMTRGLQDVIATFPGWATEDNGLLHVRGTDDGFLYVIDGVPVYERLDQLSGLGPELATIESINVMTGYVPAEFGHKAGGVIDVRLKSAATDWNATAQIERGSNADTAGVASMGGTLPGNVTVTAGLAAQQSDRFLDPVHPDNLHNRGHAASSSGQFTWAPSASHIVSSSFGFARMEYDVPNTGEQEDAGQDQQQRIEQAYGSVSWQRAWSSSLFSQLSGYLRHGSARLDGSPQDTPLFAQADRSLSRVGALAAFTRQAGRHTIKAGAEIQRLALDESFLFGVTDPEAAEDAGLSDAAIAHTLRAPFSFFGIADPTMWSAFAQDEWAATSQITLSAGIRFDQSRLLLNRTQVSPRVGVAYRVGDRTVLRGSASRFLQPPQPENLLLSSSVEARELSPFAEDGGEGGADVEPERQWAFEAGVNHRIGAVFRIDAAIWYRRIGQAADPNVFAGTTIIFPNAVALGRARGIDVRLEMARRRSWSGYLNASLGRVRQRGPITGGLFLEDEIAELGSGEEFIPDHDQRLVAGGGVTWTPERPGVVIAATVRYETGTPIARDDDDEEALQDRPGADMVDFASGRVAPRTVASLQAEIPVWTHGSKVISIRGSVLNLFNDEYAYNFGNPFSGTHFGAPLTFALAVRARF